MITPQQVADNLNSIRSQNQPRIEVSYAKPQIRKTSQPVTYWEDKEVRLLVGPFASPTQYNRDGSVSKRQPPPYQIGDIVFVRYNATNGYVSIYPFAMAGEGYEIIEDAEEGVHYEFLDTSA